MPLVLIKGSSEEGNNIVSVLVPYSILLIFNSHSTSTRWIQELTMIIFYYSTIMSFYLMRLREQDVLNSRPYYTVVPQLQLANRIRCIYYSTVMSFHQIRSIERAKYEAVIHCNVPV